MRKISIAILTLVLTIGFFIPSCQKIDCSCGPALPYLDIEEILPRHYDQNQGFVDSGDSTIFQLYRLWLLFDGNYYAEAPAWDFHFSLMPTANACSCLPSGYEGSFEKLQQLSIITLNDFDPDHLANENINDLLLVEEKEIADFIAEQTDFSLGGQGLKLALKKAPELNQDFLVRIEITLDNGEEYTLNPTAVRIRR